MCGEKKSVDIKGKNQKKKNAKYPYLFILSLLKDS